MKKIILTIGVLIAGASIACAGVFIDNNSNNPMSVKIVATTDLYAVNSVTNNNPDQSPSLPSIELKDGAMNLLTIPAGKDIYLVDPSQVGQDNILFQILNKGQVDAVIYLNSELIKTIGQNDVTFGKTVKNGDRYIVRTVKTINDGQDTVVPVQDTVESLQTPSLATISNNYWQLAENALLYTEQVSNDLNASAPSIEAPLYLENALNAAGFTDSVTSVLNVSNKGAYTVSGEMTGLINSIKEYNATNDQSVKSEYSYLIAETNGMLSFYLTKYLQSSQVGN